MTYHRFWDHIVVIFYMIFESYSWSSMIYPLIIKQGVLENPLYMEVSSYEHHLFLWCIFHQAMFDDTGGCNSNTYGLWMFMALIVIYSYVVFLYVFLGFINQFMWKDPPTSPGSCFKVPGGGSQFHCAQRSADASDIGRCYRCAPKGRLSQYSEPRKKDAANIIFAIMCESESTKKIGQ